MKRTIYVAMALVITLPAAALAQDRGSAEDQLACTPDVYKLCSSHIPDEDAITTCLVQHKSQLSPGCKAVFSRPAAVTPKGQDDD